MSRLSNKVAVITGGTSGIGLATAKRFIAEGADVVITGRNREALASALAELGDRGVRINALSPGLIETPLVGKLGLNQDEVDAFGARIVEQTPLGRLGQAEEIAATAAFLASEDASYFTGADLVADGGLTHV